MIYDDLSLLKHILWLVVFLWYQIGNPYGKCSSVYDSKVCEDKSRSTEGELISTRSKGT